MYQKGIKIWGKTQNEYILKTTPKNRTNTRYENIQQRLCLCILNLEENFIERSLLWQKYKNKSIMKIGKKSTNIWTLPEVIVHIRPKKMHYRGGVACHDKWLYF